MCVCVCVCVCVALDSVVSSDDEYACSDVTVYDAVMYVYSMVHHSSPKKIPSCNNLVLLLTH